MVIIRSHYYRNKGRQFRSNTSRDEFNPPCTTWPGRKSVRQEAEVALAYSTILAEQTDLSALSPPPRLPPQQTMRYRASILPRSHPRRSMIGAYGDTACSPRREAQARKPQLGAS